MVICYDISRPRTRARVADELESRAVRVQRSVFEASLGKAEAEKLFKRLSLMLDPGDKLRMYGITRHGLARSLDVGGPPLPEEGAFWLV